MAESTQGPTNFATDWNQNAPKAANPSADAGSAPQNAGANNVPQIYVLGQFISKKDFKNEGSVEVVCGKFVNMPPTASVKVFVSAPQLDEANKYRVDVSANIHVFLMPPGDKAANGGAGGDPHTLFTLDLVYTGIFSVTNTPSEDMLKQILLVYCPSLMFPFVRSAVADTTKDSGCPTLLLDPVDFAAIYRDNMNKQAQ